VIIIDDLLATGGTIAAAEQLISNFQGVEVLANVVIWEIPSFNGRSKLANATHSIISL
jgi:adenine/guanine phosphoribosyltransferase-like PRPP-binding protein